MENSGKPPCGDAEALPETLPCVPARVQGLRGSLPEALPDTLPAQKRPCGDSGPLPRSSWRAQP
eukprot:6696582-Pyramimonas_sp.AAC.1